jgi:superfamily II DNA or RNA helicase
MSHSQFKSLIDDKQPKDKDGKPWFNRFDTIVVDEAHLLLGKTTNVAHKLLMLYERYLILVSGTPIGNNANELFAQLSLLTSAFRGGGYSDYA